jgi:hypothetical protein
MKPTTEQATTMAAAFHSALTCVPMEPTNLVRSRATPPQTRASRASNPPLSAHRLNYNEQRFGKGHVMAEEIGRVDHYSVSIPNKADEGARVLGALRSQCGPEKPRGAGADISGTGDSAPPGGCESGSRPAH